MAKAKRPEIKITYDLATLFIILFFLYELAKVLSPSWKEGIRYLGLGCSLCAFGILGLLFYMYVIFDGTARKLRELFFYYNMEGMNGFPKYRGKSSVNYRWLYGKEIQSRDGEGNKEAVLVSPFEESSTIDEFYKNNDQIVQYSYSLPVGITVSDIGKKMEGIVEHLERDVIIIYENKGFAVIVGNKTKRKFIQKL